MEGKVHRTHSRQFSGGAVYMNKYGSVQVSPSGYLYNTYVDPKHRGKGYAQELLSMAIQDADRNQKTLKTNPEEDWMIQALLEKQGFEPTNEHLGIDEWAHRPGYVRHPRKG